MKLTYEAALDQKLFESQCTYTNIKLIIKLVFVDRPLMNEGRDNSLESFTMRSQQTMLMENIVYLKMLKYVCQIQIYAVCFNQFMIYV